VRLPECRFKNPVPAKEKPGKRGGRSAALLFRVACCYEHGVPISNKIKTAARTKHAQDQERYMIKTDECRCEADGENEFPP
jgi:hypothetical protein